jgi:predicted transposase YbfD/YdcC
MSALSAFDNLPDPRKQHLVAYELKSLVFITISAVVSGYETFTEIALFAESKRDWITGHVPLPKGKTPSHDTFGDLFSTLCPEKFCDCFVAWVSTVCNITEGELVAIDGKRLRGSYDRYDGKAAIHMVSAWAAENQLVLGQIKVDDKSNEITAIPKLLEILELKGAIVSIDAMGCQKEIAKQIVGAEAGYLLALKGNQSALKEQVEGAFEKIPPHSVHLQEEKGHGRIEARKCTVVTDLALIEECENWKSLCSIIKIESIREEVLTGKRTEETRYYISSVCAGAERFNRLVRQHWGIENQVHWTLDVTFGEDSSRVRKGHADQNLSAIRRIALNMLKLDQSKGSINIKRKKAALNDGFRQVLMKI